MSQKALNDMHVKKPKTMKQKKRPLKVDEEDFEVIDDNHHHHRGRQNQTLSENGDVISEDHVPFQHHMIKEARVMIDSVETYAKKAKYRKTLLHSMNLTFPEGTVTAIIGPSGAGRSTLLEVLSNSLPINLIGVGTVHIPGTSVICPQDDRLHGFFTCESYMYHYARLTGMDKWLTKEELKEKIDNLLLGMGLLEHKDTKVGDVFMKGLSGGQRRRLSVCLEALSDPNNMFLDEPTSGLDAESALQVMEFLSSYSQAATGRRVILTIHQPNSFIWNLIDNVILLSKGKLLYEGKRADMEAFFKKNGHPTPKGWNPADHYVTMVNDEFRNHALSVHEWAQRYQLWRAKQHSKGPVEHNNALVTLSFPPELQQKLKAKNDKKANEESSSSSSSSEEDDDDNGDNEDRYKYYNEEFDMDLVDTVPRDGASRDGVPKDEASKDGLSRSSRHGTCSRSAMSQTTAAATFAAAAIVPKGPAHYVEAKRIGGFTAVRELTYRYFLNLWFNPGILATRVAMYSMLALMVGALFWGLGERTDYESVISRAAVLFYCVSFFIFMSVAVLPFTVMERAIVDKEVANQYYHPIFYQIAQALASIPGAGVLALLVSVIIISMLKFKDPGWYFLNMFLALTTSEALAQLVSHVVPHFVIGMALVAGLYGFFMLFQGFMLVPSDFPNWLRWTNSIAFHTYSWRSFMVTEFRGDVFYDVDNDPLEYINSLAFATGEDVLRFYEIEDTIRGNDMLVLMFYTIVLHLLGFVVLHIRHTWFRGAMVPFHPF